MEYNINFCIISAVYLSITAFFYKRQPHVPSRRSSLFAALLLCGIVSLALDIAAAVLDARAWLWPSWAVYAVNIVFLLITQLSGVLFFQYTVNLTGTYRRMSRAVRMLIILPFAALAVFLLLSPFTDGGIFYLDAQNVYHHGPLHLALYLIMGLYLLSSLIIVFVRRRRLQKQKFYTILLFMAATLAAMLIQMSNPYLLVNSTANAFALTLIYHILESPGNHIDALTGVYNRAALPGMLRDIFEEGERCSLIIYSVDSIQRVNNSFGMKGGDALLCAFAEYLNREFPKHRVVRNEGDAFCVLARGGERLGRACLEELRARIPESFDVGVFNVALECSLCCINSEDCASADDMSTLADNLSRICRADWRGGILLADGEFKKNVVRRGEIELALARALDEERVEVFFQPIHDAGGRLCALESLVRVSDPELGPLPTQEMVELAEKNGSIVRLGEQVLRRTCDFIRDNHVEQWGLDHVGINLSAIQCTRKELPDEIESVITQSGVAHGLLAFEVTETAAGALASLKENMDLLLERGTYFLFDDFGTGYANFKSMALLPYRCVKIDRSLLLNAVENEQSFMMLAGIVKVIHSLGLVSLCEGVETAQQLELLKSLNVKLLQGYYFSKPLSGEMTVLYAKKAGVC